MKTLPYCPLHGTHRAFSWTPSDSTDVGAFITRWKREHTADDLAPNLTPHAYGDDYDHNERTAHLDLPGEFA